VCFVVAASGGGAFYVVKLVIEPHYMQQTHSAGYIKHRKRTE